MLIMLLWKDYAFFTFLYAEERIVLSIVFDVILLRDWRYTLLTSVLRRC